MHEQMHIVEMAPQTARESAKNPALFNIPAMNL